MPKIINVPNYGDVEFPDDMSDEEIVAAIQRNAMGYREKEVAPDPTEGMGNFEKFAAGAGKGLYDIARGAGTLATDIMPSLAKYGVATRKDVDEARARDAALMSTKAGMAGNVIGNIAGLLPAAFVPGVNSVSGGMAAGSLLSAIEPVGKNDSRTRNMTIGGAFGGAAPLLVKGGRAAKAAIVDPFTDAGSTRIAAREVLAKASDPKRMLEDLAIRKAATTGFNPTVGQLTDQAGVSALERSLRTSRPQSFDRIDKEQMGALVDAINSIRQTPEAREKLVKAVSEKSGGLYKSALGETMPVTPELAKLANRPSMMAAEKRAIKLAAESTDAPYKTRLLDMVPHEIPIKTKAQDSFVSKPIYDSLGMSYGDDATKILGDTKIGYISVPPIDNVPVRDMHTLKMGLDALLSDPTTGIAKLEANAIKKTREKFLDLLPQTYQDARLQHIAANKPIHQIDIANEIYNRFVPSLADQGGLPFRSTAASYAKALRDGDSIAKNVTGFKNAKLRDIMTPEQMGVLVGVAKDASMKAAAESARGGVGSQTAQHLAMSNIARRAGIPSSIASILRVPAGIAARAGDLAYAHSDEVIKDRIALLLQNPELAAAEMNQLLLRDKIGDAASRPFQYGLLTMPTILNANQSTNIPDK